MMNIRRWSNYSFAQQAPIQGDNAPDTDEAVGGKCHVEEGCASVLEEEQGRCVCKWDASQGCKTYLSKK